MRKILLRSIVCVLLLCGLPVVAEAAKIPIVGATSDAAPQIPPTGLCTGGRTLTLTDGGTVTTAVSATGIAVFKAAPLESAFGGVGYALATETATNNTRLVTYNLDAVPATVTGNVLVTTAGVPDLANSLRANIYDPTRVGAGGFLEWGVQQTAPCVAGLTNCLHIRGYTNTSTSIDLAYTGVVGINGTNVAYEVPDSSSYWLAYQTAAGSTIRKFDSALNAGSAIAFTPNPYADMTSDSTYVYAMVNIGGVQNIRRIRISDLAMTDFPLVGATGSTAITHVDGNLYIGVAQAGTGNIKRVDTSTMTVTGTIVLGPSEGIVSGGMSYDTANNRLYTVAIDGVSAVYRRVNLSTFLSEQSLVNAVGFPEANGTGFDFPHQHIWQVTRGANLLLSKVNLCS